MSQLNGFAPRFAANENAGLFSTMKILLPDPVWTAPIIEDFHYFEYLRDLPGVRIVVRLR